MERSVEGNLERSEGLTSFLSRTGKIEILNFFNFMVCSVIGEVPDDGQHAEESR